MSRPGTTKHGGGAAGTLGAQPLSMSDSLSHKSVMEKQRAAIDTLRQQNARLKEDLLLENKFSVKPSNVHAAQAINKLQEEADLYTRKIQLEHRKVMMLQQQQEQLTAKLGQTRSAMGSIFSAKQKTQGLQKQIKITEDRLEKQYIKYNEAVTYNKQLREHIDNLRRERLMFETIDGNLVKDLARVKRCMASTITAANEANAAKEKALAEASALKLAMEREHAAYEEEWRQLTHLIDEDRRARDLARQNEMAERERQTQELLKSCEATAANKKKAARTAWSIGMNKAMAQNVSHQKLRLYNEAFAKVQAATGIQDMDELVQAFAAAKDASFNLYTYVNEVDAEVESLEDSITRMQGEINEYTEHVSAEHVSAGASASSVHAKLQEAQARAAAHESRLQSALQVVEQLQAGISSLFEAAGCNTEAVRLLLGGNGLSDATMLAHLGIIEQRSNELLQAYMLSKAEGAELPEPLHAQPLAEAAASTGSHRIVVEPPCTTDQSPVGPRAVHSGGFGAPPGTVLGHGARSSGGEAAAADAGCVQAYAQAGVVGLAGNSERSGSGTATAAGDECVLDDVPLTRAQLQAKVHRGLESILERSVRVLKATSAAAGGPPTAAPAAAPAGGGPRPAGALKAAKAAKQDAAV